MLQTKKSIWALLIILVSQFYLNPAYSQEVKSNELGNTIKEIFVKGSINEDKLFLVLGMENAKEVAGEALKEAVDLNELRDIGKDSARMFQRMGRRIYNSNHSNDIIGNIGNSGEFSAEMAPEIFRWPWKSLKKIPGAHKVDMQRARDARANANNSVTAAMQYSGLAVWAKLKGAYYLVIEAPVGMAAALSATTLAVPVVTAYELARIPISFVLGTLGKTIRIGYVAAKAIVLGSFAVATLTYSALSTGTAIVATTVAAGAIAAVKLTAKIVKAPLKIGKKAETIHQTKINYSKLKDFANTIKANLNKDELDALGLDIESVTSDLMDYKSTIKVKSNLLGKEKTAMVIKVGIEFNNNKDEQNIKLSSYIKPKHFKALSNKLGLSKKELKDLLNGTLTKIMSELENSYSQAGE